MNDVRKMIYGTLIGFFLMLVVWFSIIYISACGFTLSCHRGDQVVERTPIPTLIPVSHGEMQAEPVAMEEFNKCKITAMDLTGAWVTAGSSETDAFPFTDLNGQACEGTYGEDVQPLFVENNLWHPSALGCVSCHNADLSMRSAGLDMTTYPALFMGSQRADAVSKGTDIFGGGNWEKSVLYDVLNQGLVPEGHSAEVPASNPIIFAGATSSQTEAMPTP